MIDSKFKTSIIPNNDYFQHFVFVFD